MHKISYWIAFWAGVVIERGSKQEFNGKGLLFENARELQVIDMHLSCKQSTVVAINKSQNEMNDLKMISIVSLIRYIYRRGREGRSQN